MEENKVLNEERYQKSAKKLKAIGIIVLIIGIIILVAGVVLTFAGFNDFGSSSFSMDIDTQARNAASSMGMFALGGFLDIIGFFIAAVGGMLLFMAHRREIAAFTVQQTMPVAKEGIEEIAPSLGKAAKELSKGVQEGKEE